MTITPIETFNALESLIKHSTWTNNLSNALTEEEARKIAELVKRMDKRIKALESVNIQLMHVVGEETIEMIEAAVAAAIEDAAQLAELGKEQGVAKAIRTLPKNDDSLKFHCRAARHKAFEDIVALMPEAEKVVVAILEEEGGNLN